MPTSPPPADAPRDVLRRVFGFDDFLDGQREVISRLLDGRSVLAIFPTGGGKSLCYQLPALMLDGLTLVISPLIALMKDQLDFLTARGAPAGRLDSSLDREETLAVFDGLASGRLKLLYVSPERLNNERFLKSIARRPIAMLAVDEAHCISEWGHNFRPDYLKIARLARELKVGRVLALTATAPPEVARDVCRGFGVAEEDVVHTGFYRPNLRLVVTPCAPAERDGLLLARLAERPPGPTVVYVTLQRTAERVAEVLAAAGYDARAYHAGMGPEKRNQVQDAFMASDRAIVVATIAFGMGIDKADIRAIYHYNLPKSLESYSQEIGRAGRDGQPSVCEMLACADDRVVLENFSYGDTPTDEAVESLTREVLSQGDEFDVSIYDLSGEHDVRPLVVRTLLTYLELDGVIRSTGPFYTGFRFQPQRSSKEILARFDAARADFLRRVFQQAKKGRTWFTIDAHRAAEAIGEPRDRIAAALGYLEEQGDLVLEASGVREGFRIEARPGDEAALARSLAERFRRREEQDVERVRRVLKYAEERECLTRHLLNYFGESRSACGHCARCDGVPFEPLPPPTYKPLTPDDAEAVGRLRAENHPALATPRQLARFLCGLSSPATTRARLRKHEMFGAYAGVPFHDVLGFVTGK